MLCPYELQKIYKEYCPPTYVKVVSGRTQQGDLAWSTDKESFNSVSPGLEVEKLTLVVRAGKIAIWESSG